MNVRQGRDGKHGFHQDILRDGPQTTGTRASREGRLGNLFQTAVGEMELHVVHGQQCLVLSDQGILGNGQNVNQHRHVQSPRRHNHGETTDKLGYETVLHQIVGDSAVKVVGLDLKVIQFLLHLRTKPNGSRIYPAINDPLETSKGTTTYKQNVGRINL